MNGCPPTTIVPDLIAPVFAVTENPTEPAPVPGLPEEIESQSAPLVTAADQPQPASVVTAIEPDPPAISKFCDVGASEIVHPDAWVAVKVWLPAVIVPVRSGPAFARALNPTVPGPLPVGPLVTCSQGAFAIAVQAQPSDVFTVKLAVPPGEGISSEPGSRVYAQTMPVWSILKL